MSVVSISRRQCRKIGPSALNEISALPEELRSLIFKALKATDMSALMCVSQLLKEHVIMHLNPWKIKMIERVGHQLRLLEELLLAKHVTGFTNYIQAIKTKIALAKEKDSLVLVKQVVLAVLGIQIPPSFSLSFLSNEEQIALNSQLLLNQTSWVETDLTGTHFEAGLSIEPNSAIQNMKEIRHFAQILKIPFLFRHQWLRNRQIEYHQFINVDRTRMQQLCQLEKSVGSELAALYMYTVYMMTSFHIIADSPVNKAIKDLCVLLIKEQINVLPNMAAQDLVTKLANNMIGEFANEYKMELCQQLIDCNATVKAREIALSMDIRSRVSFFMEQFVLSVIKKFRTFQS